jgi:hypothetical protein
VHGKPAVPTAQQPSGIRFGETPRKIQEITLGKSSGWYLKVADNSMVAVLFRQPATLFYFPKKALFSSGQYTEDTSMSAS